MISRRPLIGMRMRAGPSAAVIPTNAAVAAATPISAERQPRVTPTARMRVSASTISTAEARNTAVRRTTPLMIRSL